MKKNKLYTMHKGMPAMFVDRQSNNIFDGWYNSYLQNAQADKQANPWNYVDDKDLVSQYAQQSKNAFGISKAANPFSKGNLMGTFSKEGLKDMAGGAAGQLLDMGANLVGGLANNAISGGLSSGAGSAISGIGSTVGGVVGSVNPVLGAGITVGSQVLGGLTNAAFGTKVNEAQKKEVEAGINQNLNFVSNASSFDDIKGPQAVTTNTDVYEGGWFSGGSADKKNEELKRRMLAAKSFAERSVDNNVFNLASDQMNNALANYSAFGGPLDMGGGALDYGLAMDYLTMKNQQNEAKNRVPGISPMPAINTFGHGGCFNPFALGGDVQMHGADFTNGLIVPSDNTRVFRPMMLPIQRHQNFSDSEYFWDAGKEYPAGLWKHKDGTFHTTGSYGKDIVLTQEEADSIIRATKAKNRREKLRKAMENHKQTNSSENLFAFGGDMQTNSSDFPTGLMHIDAGQSHEQNPNEGVQLGTDQNGVPNLVEENETVWNDYVFSARIPIDQTTKELFHIGKKREMTYADLSKKLEKEISERVNDPISRAGFEKQMEMLEEQQERQKQEMDAQRAKAAFEALSPEEQVAVMEGAAQQEAMAEQAAMQQPSPEEIAIAQHQQAMADGSEAMIGQEPQMNCFGGRINRFDNGGQAYTKMLNSLGFHTQKEFDDWAKENSIDFGDIWKDNPNTLSIDILGKLWSNEKFKEALKKKNPALAHAFETKGYDFGTYVPTSNSRATIQSISKGNWKATNGQGWFGSEDLAFKQATEGMSENEIKALTTEQLAERMAKTDAYKNTSKWLENSDNALMYLNTLLNDPDTPDVAKKHALQYVKDGKWKDGYKYNYNDVFGKVRSTNPGTYWHTAMEANRGNEANYFVINEDGSIEPILGNVPTDWTSAGNYSWADKDSDYTYNYYKRPAVAAKPEAAKAPEEKKAEEEKGVAPKHRAEWLRYAGLFGPAVGLGMMAAGVGRPDTAQLDAAVAGAGDVNTADWKPLGNYLTYRPLDIWFEQNRLNANARATDRAIINNASPIGTKMAGLLAAGYNGQIASGNLFRQAQEYNDNLRKQVAEFNRGTDQFNSEQYGATSRFNADAYNNARRANAQLRLQAAAQKMDADAGWYNSLYGNIAGLFKGIGDIGTENFRMNRIGEMAARGDFGTTTDETYGFEPYLTRSNKKSKKNR